MKKVIVAATIWVAVAYCVDSYFLHGKYYEMFLRKAGQVYQRVRYSGPHGNVVITVAFHVCVDALKLDRRNPT